MAQDTTNTTITFRLPEELFDEVARRASADGVSKHEFCRKLVVSSLLGSNEPIELDVDAVQDAFESLHFALVDLRAGLGRGIGAILQDLSPNRNKEEIRKWVFERIITPSSQKPAETPEGDDSP